MVRTGSLGVADEPLFSSDIINDPRGDIVQLDMRGVVVGDLVATSEKGRQCSIIVI